MTIDDLTLAISIKMGLDNTAASEDLLQMQQWAKEGIEYVQMETEVFVSLGDLVLTIGISDYRLDSSVLAIIDRQIYGTDGLHYLEQTDSRTLLDLRRQGGRLACRLFALSGNDLFMVEGAPAVAETIRFTYVPAVDWEGVSVGVGFDVELSDEAMGGIPTWAQKAIEFYMLREAAIRDDKQLGLTFEKAQAMLDREVKLIRRRILGKKGRRLSPVRIGRTSTDKRYPNGYIPRSPGIDW